MELLDYVEDEDEKEDLKEAIWCQAVLRNDWDNINHNYPIETCKNLIFCQLFDLLNMSGNR